MKTIKLYYNVLNANNDHYGNPNHWIQLINPKLGTSIIGENYGYLSDNHGAAKLAKNVLIDCGHKFYKNDVDSDIILIDYHLFDPKSELLKNKTVVVLKCVGFIQTKSMSKHQTNRKNYKYLLLKE